MKQIMSSWPTNADAHAHMRLRQRQNHGRRVSAEDWMATYLDRTGYQWTRQAQWGFRLFDFWCRDLGYAVEVDGPTHDPVSDQQSDDEMMRRSAIIVLRVRNWNAFDAARALQDIGQASRWNIRREMFGLKPIKNSP